MDSRLPNTGTTIFTVMSQLAADCGALNLSQGFPEFDPDPELVELVSRYMRDGANQYAPMMGIPPLREAIAEKVSAVYGYDANPDTEVTVCSGATEGLFSTIQATVRPGDEVILFDPAYDSYEPSVTLASAVARRIPLATTPECPDLHIDWAALEAALSKRTRLIIMNFPHNPCGAILDPGDLDRLAELLRGRGVYLLSDEVYEHIVFDGNDHQSLLRHEELRERAFVVSSFGKTYHVTGWKIGYCIAPPGLTVEFRKTHQWNTFSTVTPMQFALADFMRARTGHYDELTAFYQAKRDLFVRLLRDSRFELRPAAGTFFQVLDYARITDAPDVEFARTLTQEIGVASIPVSVFSETAPESRQLRFCFAKNDDTLREAARRLCQL